MQSLRELCVEDRVRAVAVSHLRLPRASRRFYAQVHLGMGRYLVPTLVY